MNRIRTFRAALPAIGALAFFASSAAAEIEVNLEWRPADQTVNVGDTVNIGLFAVADDPDLSQSMAAMDVIIFWDAMYLQLLGIDDTGGPGWLTSGFPNDPYGLNEAIPPQDGDGLYTAFAQFGDPVYATPEGALVTTFQFSALAETAGAALEILESAGLPLFETIVYSGDTPNLAITGTLGSALVTIVPEPGALSLLFLSGLCVLRRKR